MKTKYHHIQRHAGTPPPGGSGATQWAVRWYDGEGRRRAKTFVDRKHSGTEAALQAALAFRDAALAEAEQVRQQRIRHHFIPALTPAERRRLRARMIDADCRGSNRHFRVRVSADRDAVHLRQVYFPIRKYGSAKLAFRAALRVRDRCAAMPLMQRKEVLA